MDIFLIFGLFILVVAAILVVLGFLLYSVPKNLGYPKTGKYLATIYGVLMMIIIMLTVFEDRLFTKSDAKKLIDEQEIFLKDDFDLVKNETSSPIGDYYHTFTLKISEKDKLKAIEQIKTSKNYKMFGEPLICRENIDRYNGIKQTQNYETPSCYVREYFQPNGRGYAPTFRQIFIYKNGNQLIFEDIDE